MQMQGQKQQQQNAQSQREAYRQQKLAELNEIFYCQCGKNYLTFAALYLHARNKHEVRLTTRRSQKVCRTQLVNGKNNVTYYIKKDEQQQPVISSLPSVSRQRSKTAAIDVFQVLETYRQLCGQRASALLRVFVQYMRRVKDIVDVDGSQLIEQIPLFINQFIMFYLPTHQGRQSSFCPINRQILIEMCEWLTRQELTKYRVILTKVMPYN